jgi:poly(A) polymerase Pap1
MNTNNGNNNIDGQTSVGSYGITQPISTKGPDPSDRIATENLEEALRSYDYFESDAELAHRVDVMAKLNTLVKKWIRDVSLAKNIPPAIVDTVGGRVHTFGSYRLGVHSKGKKNFSYKSIQTQNCKRFLLEKNSSNSKHRLVRQTNTDDVIYLFEAWTLIIYANKAWHRFCC